MIILTEEEIKEIKEKMRLKRQEEEKKKSDLFYIDEMGHSKITPRQEVDAFKDEIR